MILPGPGRRIRDRQREARAPLRESKHIKACDVHFTANPTSSPRPTTAAYRAIAAVHFSILCHPGATPGCPRISPIGARQAASPRAAQRTLNCAPPFPDQPKNKKFPSSVKGRLFMSTTGRFCGFMPLALPSPLPLAVPQPSVWPRSWHGRPPRFFSHICS